MAASVIAPLKRALEAGEEVDRVLRLSMHGIAQLSKSVPLVEAVQEVVRVLGDDVDPVKSERDLASARLEAEFAQRELERGFPILHSHATVALWGILEAAIDDVVLELLGSNASSLANPSLASIKISLADFEQLDKSDRLRYLLAEYTRNSKADLKFGVTRFETLLEIVHLSGPVEESLRRDVFEHQQVRNVIVHRAAHVDRRLRTQCPWLDLQVGTPIQVSHTQYVRYHDATFAYLMEILKRMLIRRGLTREQAEAMIRAASTKDSPNDDSPNPPIEMTRPPGG